jgi:hypothetical protein
MIIFIRIVLVYFIIGCAFGLCLNWTINVLFADKAKWLNRKPKEEATKAMILCCVFLWPLCLGVGIYKIIKNKSKMDDDITNLILDDDFYDEES